MVTLWRTGVFIKRKKNLPLSQQIMALMLFSSTVVLVALLHAAAEKRTGSMPSMGRDISNKEIQLTVQGQTVSSNFGTIDSAQFNIEQLIHAGIANELFPAKENTLTRSEEKLLRQLSEDSYEAYMQLKNHPAFVDYLAEISPLRFYSRNQYWQQAYEARLENIRPFH